MQMQKWQSSLTFPKIGEEYFSSAVIETFSFSLLLKIVFDVLVLWLPEFFHTSVGITEA